MVLAPLPGGICLAESHERLPMITLLDDSQNYWLPRYVNIASQSDAFVDIVNASVSLSRDTASEAAVTFHTECFS